MKYLILCALLSISMLGNQAATNKLSTTQIAKKAVGVVFFVAGSAGISAVIGRHITIGRYKKNKEGLICVALVTNFIGCLYGGCRLLAD